MFGMEIPDTMINDAFKQLAGYKYYKAKKAESEKAKAAEEPEEQNESLIKSGIGKGQKLKVPVVEDPAVQSLLDLRKGSKASRLESLRQKKQAVERANETDDADDSDMDLTNDEPKGDDDTTREYDQKLEARTNINVSEAFEKAFQARNLTEIKKLLPTHISTAVVNYVMPRLNSSMLDVMKNNQINLFTKSSTSIDDLSEMDLKIKPLNRIYLNKSNDTHTTHQQLYDTLYESITLDQEAINSQDVELSFHKGSHNN
ncbi:hypothetical protein Tco_1361141 [Tanacetum coccineum]